MTAPIRITKPRRLALVASGGLGFIAVFLTIVLVALPVQAATNCTPDPSWATSRSDLAGQVVSLLNQYRVQQGKAALSGSGPLAASATWKSMHMAGYGYFAHDDPAPPVARSAFQRARDCDYGGSNWGENIAYGYPSAQAVMDGWKASPGHNSNMLGNYTTVGVGVAQTSGGTLYWTQVFGNDAGGSSPPPPSPPPASPPSPPPASPTPPPPASPSPPPASPPPASPPPASPRPPAAPPAAPGSPSAPAPTSGGSSSPRSLERELAAGVAIGAHPALTENVTAGERMTAKVRITLLESGKALEDASVHCRAEIEGKRLRVVANVFRGGRALCAWLVPDSAGGKVLRGWVSAELPGTQALRSFVRLIE